MLKINWYSELVSWVQDDQKDTFHFSVLWGIDFSGTSYKWKRLSDILLVFHSAFILHLCKYEVPHVLGQLSTEFSNPKSNDSQHLKANLTGIFHVRSYTPRSFIQGYGLIPLFPHQHYAKSFSHSKAIWKDLQTENTLKSQLLWPQEWFGIPKHQGHHSHELDVILIAMGLFILWISQIYSALYEHHRGGFYTQKPM